MRDVEKGFNKAAEDLRSKGEDPKDIHTADRFAKEAVGAGIDGKGKGRGKMLLGLVAVREQMTPGIRKSWSAGRFTAVLTDKGFFDAKIVSIAKHFDKHGYPYGDILSYTRAANRYWNQHGRTADCRLDEYGVTFMWLPNGQYTRDGRILTFYYHAENA